MLKTLIIATALLPTLVIAQQSQQLPQPRQPGQWCPVGWRTSGSYCVPGSDKAPAALRKNGWCPAGWRARAAAIASAEGPQPRASPASVALQVIAKPAQAELVALVLSCHTVLAATNKCLAQNNKSGTLAKTTKRQRCRK